MTQQPTITRAQLLEQLRTTGEKAVARLRAIPPEGFEEGRYESGWNGRQILAHVASIEWSYPRLIDVARQAQAPAPQTTGETKPDLPTRPATGGINDYNERQVEKRAASTVAELIAEFETNRAATIAAFGEADEALLQVPIRSAGGVTGPLANVVSMIAIMHVEGHINDIAGPPARS